MRTTDSAQHHRDVANQALGDAGRFGVDDAKRATYIAEAQVEATLAVSEEQRTANLLAIAALGWELTEDQRLAIAVRAGLA